MLIWRNSIVGSPAVARRSTYAASGIVQTNYLLLISPTHIIRAQWPGGKTPTATGGIIAPTDPRLPTTNDFVYVRGAQKAVTRSAPVFDRGESIRIDSPCSGDAMPMLPPRFCASCGRRTAAHGVCECRRARKAEREKSRPGARRRGYDGDWEGESEEFLARPENRYCACGCGRLADMVDHIIAHKGDMRLFWSRANWQPMARACNSRKAAKQEGGFGNPLREAQGAHLGRMATPHRPSRLWSVPRRRPPHARADRRSARRRYESLSISERYTVRPYQASVNVTVPCRAFLLNTGDRMSRFRDRDNLIDRQSNSAAAKKAMLEKFRAAANDPEIAARRSAIEAERLARRAERFAAGIEREAKRAEQLARDAEIAAKAKRETEEAEAVAAAELAEREATLKAEQKAARDMRYAARKAAKKGPR